jgi:hypothetical protein
MPRQSDTVGEREFPNWRDVYRLDYERDAQGRIKELLLISECDLFGFVAKISATPDGYLYLEEVDPIDEPDFVQSEPRRLALYEQAQQRASLRARFTR